jgi:hypothetical protein
VLRATESSRTRYIFPYLPRPPSNRAWYTRWRHECSTRQRHVACVGGTLPQVPRAPRRGWGRLTRAFVFCFLNHPENARRTVGAGVCAHSKRAQGPPRQQPREGQPCKGERRGAKGHAAGYWGALRVTHSASSVLIIAMGSDAPLVSICTATTTTASTTATTTTITTTTATTTTAFECHDCAEHCKPECKSGRLPYGGCISSIHLGLNYLNEAT